MRMRLESDLKHASERGLELRDGGVSVVEVSDMTAEPFSNELARLAAGREIYMMAVVGRLHRAKGVA